MLLPRTKIFTHDSFIVIKRHEQRLIQIMTKAFQGQYSTSGFVPIDAEQGAEQELDQGSIMGKYLSSWQEHMDGVRTMVNVDFGLS